ncbi:hypothetical protein BC332_00385 [Capsicum chinense]|nr:hypothetical protein BC332_00385 [Capsicum chinense]
MHNSLPTKAILPHREIGDSCMRSMIRRLECPAVYYSYREQNRIGGALAKEGPNSFRTLSRIRLRNLVSGTRHHCVLYFLFTVSLKRVSGTRQATRDSAQYEWLELIGVEIMKTKAVVERTNSAVTGVPFKDKGCFASPDLSCCNRVFLCPDANGLIREKPEVG